MERVSRQTERSYKQDAAQVLLSHAILSAVVRFFTPVTDERRPVEP